MNWMEKSAAEILKHRLMSTYQMCIMLELVLILASLVAEVGEMSQTAVFFGILALLCFLRLVFLYAVMGRSKELKVIYLILMIVQAVITFVLYYTSSVFLFLCVSLVMIVILPVLTSKLCQKMSFYE